MQTHQGGFATWPGESDSYAWGSVYAAHFLTVAQKQIDLPQGLMDGVLNYLRNTLDASYNQNQSQRNSLEYILAAKAYALYVLALNGEYQAGWINSIKQRTQGLTASSKIFLAATEALRAGEPTALRDLENSKPDFSENTLSYALSSYESRARNQALLLQAWTNVDPLSERTRELAAQVAQSGNGGLWTNTQENGQAIFGLANFFKKTKANKPYTAVLKGPDGEIGVAASEETKVIKGPRIAAALSQALTIEVTGEGRPWYSGIISGVPTKAPKALAQGLAVTKTWTREDESKIDLSGSDKKVNLVIPRGEKIVVTLEVKADSPLQNVTVADLIPGGLEIVGVKDSSSGNISPRIEIREDRLIAIFPTMDRRGGIIKYELRAVTEGEFVLPPTVAEGMYEPDKKAVLPTLKVKVTAPAKK
jgi:uncharacterized protein YfaS (alpha-2-macroglobulin family)